jgi:hypothetical protein
MYAMNALDRFMVEQTLKARTTLDKLLAESYGTYVTFGDPKGIFVEKTDWELKNPPNDPTEQRIVTISSEMLRELVPLLPERIRQHVMSTVNDDVRSDPVVIPIPNQNNIGQPSATFYDDRHDTLLTIAPVSDTPVKGPEAGVMVLPRCFFEGGAMDEQGKWSGLSPCGTRGTFNTPAYEYPPSDAASPDMRVGISFGWNSLRQGLGDIFRPFRSLLGI